MLKSIKLVLISVILSFIIINLKPYGGGEPLMIMETLSFEQMEKIQGGLNCENVTSTGTQVLGLILGIGSFAGAAGALIFGPSAIGLQVANIMCAADS